MWIINSIDYNVRLLPWSLLLIVLASYIAIEADRALSVATGLGGWQGRMRDFNDGGRRLWNHFVVVCCAAFPPTFSLLWHHHYDKKLNSCLLCNDVSFGIQDPMSRSRLMLFATRCTTTSWCHDTDICCHVILCLDIIIMFLSNTTRRLSQFRFVDCCVCLLIWLVVLLL